MRVENAPDGRENRTVGYDIGVEQIFDDLSTVCRVVDSVARSEGWDRSRQVREVHQSNAARKFRPRNASLQESLPKRVEGYVT